jgi:hypothetical protein
VEVRHNTLNRFIEGLARAPDAVMREVDQDVHRVAIMGMRDARTAAPKAMSTLVNSIMTERVGPAHHRIVAEAGHASAQEHGRRPGRMPPIEAIRRWIRVRQIRGRGGISERSLAFLIARKIGREGTEAQPYMEPQRATSQDRLRRMIPLAVNRGLQEALR